MGTTVFFVLCSTRPEYNSKITLFHGLAPAAFIIHKPSPIWQLALSNAPQLIVNKYSYFSIKLNHFNYTYKTNTSIFK